MGVWNVREKMANPRASAPVSEGGPRGSAGVKVWDTPGAGSPALNWMGCDGQERREALRPLRSQETCIYPQLTVCMPPADGETQMGRPPA